MGSVVVRVTGVGWSRGLLSAGDPGHPTDQHTELLHQLAGHLDLHRTCTHLFISRSDLKEVPGAADTRTGHY